MRSGFVAVLVLCAAALPATESIELAGGVRASDTAPADAQPTGQVRPEQFN